MPGTLGQWLETFMCGQFADNFERYGYRTLQTVCQMQLPQLLSIGIPHKESELILKNIQILRQSTAAVAQQHQMQHGMSGSYDSSMAHEPHGTAFQTRDNIQAHVNYMGPDSICYSYGNPGSSVSGQFYNQSMSQSMDSMMKSGYQQQFQGHSFPQQQMTEGPQYQSMGMPSPSSGSVTSHHGYQGHVPGSPLMGHSSMHHSHPHLRNSGQNPQEVANNILHMAASSYPTNNTIQVPLSKTRSAPYHIPSRSPNYNTKLPDSQQSMCSDYGQGQFAYPSPPHQTQILMQSRDHRLSPISPASAGIMASPHSHHSGRSIPSSSPCSMNSPSKSLIRSPGPSMQLMNSPQRGQYQTTSINTSNQRMVSTVPANQQLKVSVPSSMSHSFQQCYYGTMSNSSQYQQQFQQPFSARYSPGSLSQVSEGHFSNSPGSQSRQYAHSPGGRSGHFSNISSPYTPGSGNYLSPDHTQNSPSVSRNVSDGSMASSPSMKQCNSPLQSLQKLCMLPDSQVVDPKTVVKESCAASSCDVIARTTESCSFETVCTNISSDSVCSPNLSEFVSSSEGEATKCMSGTESAVSPEIKCQPKKMMLLRAVKADMGSPLTDDSVKYGSNMSETEDSGDHKNDLNETEKKDAENKTQIKDESFVKIDTAFSDKSSENKGGSSDADNNVITETNKTDDKAGPDNKGQDTNEIYSEQDCESIESKEKNSNNLKTDITSQDAETSQDSSQSIEKCDMGSNIISSTTENVQLSTVDHSEVIVQSKNDEMAYESDISLSETESQITVCKDVNKTYNKQDRLKSFEISPRLRGDSTGSLSDERESDFEYEDHIGCDDIETGFSDIENKSNEMIEESVDDTKDLNGDLTNGSAIIDEVIITSSQWKKNGKQNVSVSQSKIHRRHVNRVPFITSVSEGDSDDVPSPVGGDVVDGLEGTDGIDNGDGTVTVTRPAHLRQRKTPVKYKDTSFFQGDFVFVEEEGEEYLQQVEPKRKLAKKNIDLNHNPKKNGVVKKISTVGKGSDGACSKTQPKIQPSLDSSVAGNLEKTMKLIAVHTEKQKGKKPKGTFKINNIKFLERGRDGGLKIIKTVSVVEAVKKEENVKSDIPKSGLSVETAPKSKYDPKHTPSQNSAAVITRRSSKQETNIEKNESVKKKVTRRQLNGVKTDSVTCEKKVRKRNSSVNQSKEKVLNTKVSKRVTEDSKPDEEIEVIEIDSDDSNEAENETGAHHNVTDLLSEGEGINKSSTSSVQCQNLVSDEENSRRSFMFSLVEDDVIDANLTSEDVGNKVETNIEQCAKLESKRSNSGSNLRCKNSGSKNNKSKQSGKGIKRKAFIDDDPDFELGPSKRPFKSLKLDKTSDMSKAKKRTDKWANFKGPKIIFEGEKETPSHCVVINDPYEETFSKKTKVTAQNVTRIEISQLPSDKSVLIPYNDTSENENWTCALCGKHSSYKFLGDLFGPYTVETMSDDMLDLSPNVRLGTKKRKSDESQTSASKCSKSGKCTESISREVNEWKEVWVHEACSVYSDGVFLIGSKIYGLQEAVRIASQTPCSLCSEMGAMIGCLNKGCQQKYHHVCAQEADCYLDEENFSLLCPKHKVKKLKQLEASTSASVG